MTKFYFRCLALSLVIFGFSNVALEAKVLDRPACRMFYNVQHDSPCEKSCDALHEKDSDACKESCQEGYISCLEHGDQPQL